MRDTEDILVVWKLDRLGRDLRHLVNVVHDLTGRGIGLKVLTGQGAVIDTTTASGKLVFGIFAAPAEFERELISERTLAGLASARARGRNGGRPYKMTPAKLRPAAASMGKPGTKVSALCTELGITRRTLYRHVSPTGELRPDGEKLLSHKQALLRPRTWSSRCPGSRSPEVCQGCETPQGGQTRDLQVPRQGTGCRPSDLSRDTRHQDLDTGSRPLTERHWP